MQLSECTLNAQRQVALRLAGASAAGLLDFNLGLHTEAGNSDCGMLLKADPKNSKAPTLKGPWTKDEDEIVTKLVMQYGPKRWSLIASQLPGRTGKQCRERWHNQLDPVIKKEAWTEEEDRVLIEAHKKMGNKWVEISKMLAGRTDNAIKNRWNSTMRRRLPNGGDDHPVAAEEDKENKPPSVPNSPPHKRSRVATEVKNELVQQVTLPLASAFPTTGRRIPTDSQPVSLSEAPRAKIAKKKGLSDTSAEDVTAGNSRGGLSVTASTPSHQSTTASSAFAGSSHPAGFGSLDGTHDFFSPKNNMFVPPDLSGEDADILTGCAGRSHTPLLGHPFSPSEFLLASPGSSSLIPTSAEARRCFSAMLYTPPSSRRSLSSSLNTLNASFATPGSCLSNNVTMPMSVLASHGRPPTCPSSNQKRKRSPTFSACKRSPSLLSVCKPPVASASKQSAPRTGSPVVEEHVCRLFH